MPDACLEPEEPEMRPDDWEELERRFIPAFHTLPMTPEGRLQLKHDVHNWLYWVTR